MPEVEVAESTIRRHVRERKFKLSEAALFQHAVNVSPGFRYGTVKKVFTAVPNQLSPLLLPQRRKQRARSPA
jgi:hypothetical protein